MYSILLVNLSTFYCNVYCYFVGIKRTIDGNIFQRLANFIIQMLTIKKKSNIVTLQLYSSLTNFLCFLENQFPQLNNESNEFG